MLRKLLICSPHHLQTTTHVKTPHTIHNAQEHIDYDLVESTNPALAARTCTTQSHTNTTHTIHNAQEHIDYDLVESTNPAFGRAVVRVNVYRNHRQVRCQVSGFQAV